MERKYAQTFLGANVPGIVGRWRSRIDWWVSKLPKVAKAMKRHAKEAQAEADAMERKELSPLKVVGDCALLCTKGLKVAVLQRSEERPSLHNVDELQALVAEYTREPMQTLVVHDKMTFDEQVAAFRSFDVLISPPTPQLTNAMFAAKNSVIIEVQSAAYDTISVPNGKNFVLSFVRSSGHLPVKMGEQSRAAKSILESHGVSLAALANASKPDSCALQVDCALTQAMEHCWGSEDTCGLHRAKAFNSVELYVDLGRIRTALEKVTPSPSPSPNPKPQPQAPTPSPNPNPQPQPPTPTPALTPTVTRTPQPLPQPGRRATLLVQVQGARRAPRAEPHEPVPGQRRLLSDEARAGGQRLLVPRVQRGPPGGEGGVRAPAGGEGRAARAPRVGGARGRALRRARGGGGEGRRGQALRAQRVYVARAHAHGSAAAGGEEHEAAKGRQAGQGQA